MKRAISILDGAKKTKMDLKFSAEAGDGRQQVKGGWQKKDVVKVLPVSLFS